MEKDTKSITARLKTDVFSHVSKDPHAAKKRLQYGSKGEAVTIISDGGNVLIVQSKSGNKYPIKREDLI